jgi:hypothetical protein
VVGVLVADQRSIWRVVGVFVVGVAGFGIHLRDTAGVVGDMGRPALQVGGVIALPLAIDLHRSEVDALDTFATIALNHFAYALPAAGINVPSIAAATQIHVPQLV